MSVRRLSLLCAASLLATQLSACDGSLTRDAGPPPNIVLILADDLGWIDTGAYGSRYYETPNIDRLAGEGVRFTDAYSASPFCSPTRAAILTGLHPARIRFTLPLGHAAEEVLDPRMPTSAPPGQRAIEAPSRTRLPLEYFTIAESLREAGYSTAHFGKWHLGDGRHLAGQQGFDVALPAQSMPYPISYFSPYAMPGLEDGPPGEHIDERMAAEAVRFMRDHKEGPFFLSLWSFSVHVPLQAKPELIAKYRRAARATNPQHNPEMGAMIETLDGSVGTILSALDELGLRENTIVLFTSDNGGMHLPVAAFYPGPPVTSNNPLRGGKGQLYEGGIRVPLIVRWPGEVEAGTVSHEVVTSTDLYPTLLEVARIAPKPDLALDGVSIVPALGRQPLSRDAVFFDLPAYVSRDLSAPATAVRAGAWKLIRFHADTEEQADRFELYRFDRDFSERDELAARFPEKVAELNALIDAHLSATSALVPAPNPDYAPEANVIEP